MKHLQKFNERKFFTVKYNDHELSVDQLQSGEWSITDHLNPKIDNIITLISDIKSRVNTKGARVYSDEADKIDQIHQLLNAPVVETPTQVVSTEIEEPPTQPIEDVNVVATELDEPVAVLDERIKSFNSFKS